MYIELKNYLEWQGVNVSNLSDEQIAGISYILNDLIDEIISDLNCEEE